MPINIEKIKAKASIVIEKKERVQVDNKVIRDLRLKLKLTQAAFAEVLGVTKKSVEKWEQGVNNINGSAMKIVEILLSNPEMISLFSPNIQIDVNNDIDAAIFRYISYNTSLSEIVLNTKELNFIVQESTFKNISMYTMSKYDQKEKVCGTKN